MASELEPLAHDWCEGFVCPLRVVGGERGVLRPDLRYPRAESLTASKDMGRCLGWPRWVVVPSALRDQAMPVPVFSAHAHPVSPKGTSTAENLSHSSELCARVGRRHSEELSWTSRGWARDCKVLVCRGGTWSVNELRPVFHSLPGVFLFESGDGGWRSGGCQLGGLLGLRVSPLVSQDV